MGMASSNLPRRVRRTIAALVMLYGIVTFSGSFLDHDFACHQRSRTHCVFCQIIHLDQKVDVQKAYLQRPARFLSGVELCSDTAGDPPALSFTLDRAPPA
jgi:hypothetical protein